MPQAAPHVSRTSRSRSAARKQRKRAPKRRKGALKMTNKRRRGSPTKPASERPEAHEEALDPSPAAADLGPASEDSDEVDPNGMPDLVTNCLKSVFDDGPVPGHSPPLVRFPWLLPTPCPDPSAPPRSLALSPSQSPSQG